MVCRGANSAIYYRCPQARYRPLRGGKFPLASFCVIPGAADRLWLDSITREITAISRVGRWIDGHPSIAKLAGLQAQRLRETEFGDDVKNVLKKPCRVRLSKGLHGT